jgi:hypothetical protein
MRNGQQASQFYLFLSLTEIIDHEQFPLYSLFIHLYLIYLSFICPCPCRQIIMTFLNVIKETLEKTEWAIKNGQSRDTGDIGTQDT